MSMEDRHRLTSGMAKKGMSDEEIRAAMGFQPLNMPEAAPEDDGAAGFTEAAGTNILSGLQSGFEGAASAIDDYTGRDTMVGDMLEDAAAAVAPSEERQERLAKRREDQGFIGEVGDAIAAEAPVLATTALAGLGAGMAAGGPVGAIVGGVLGAGYGAMRMYDQGRDNIVRGKVAEKLGKAPEEVTPEDVEAHGKDMKLTDEERMRVSAVGAMGLAEAFPATKILGKINPAKVRGVAMRSVAKKAAKEATVTGMQEGAIEVAQELGTMALTDPEFRTALADMPEADIYEVAKLISETKGRELAVSFLAGFGLGGGAGMAAGGVQQSLSNTQRKKELTALAGEARERGIDLTELERAAQDPEKVPALAMAARALSDANDRVNQIGRELEQAPAEEKPALQELLGIIEAEKEQIVDEQLGSLGVEGFQTGKQVRAQKAADTDYRVQAAKQRVANTGTGLQVKRADVSPEQIENHADRLEEATNAVEKARQRLKQATPAIRAKRQKEYRAAVEKQAVEMDAAAVDLEGRTPGEVRQQRMAQVENEVISAEREVLKDQIRSDEWADIESLTPEQRIERARKILPSKTAASKKEKVTKAEIAKLVEKRKNSQSLAERDNLTREIEAKQADLKTETPRVEVAREVIAAAEAEIAPPTGETDSKSQPAQPSMTREAQEGGTEAPSAGTEVSPTEGEAATGGTPQAGPTITAEEKLGPAKPEGPSAAPTPEQEARIAELDRAIAVKQAKIAADQALADDETKPAAGRKLARNRVRSNTKTLTDLTAERKLLASPAQPAQDASPSSSPEVAEPAPQPSQTSSPAAVEGKQTPEPEAKPQAKRPIREPREDEGWDIDRNHRYRTLLPEVDRAAGMVANEAWMREKTASMPNTPEIAATYDADGNLIGIGHNGNPNGVTPPKKGWKTTAKVFTHTHPVATPFTPSDVGMILIEGGLQEMRAILPDQTIVIRPGETPATSADTDRLWLAVRDAVLQEPSLLNATDTAFARIAQEVYLQVLDADGLIDYATPMTGFTATERTLHEKYTDLVLADPNRGRPQPDAVSGAETSGQTGGQVREDGTGLPPQAAATPRAAGTEEVIARTAALQERIKALMGETGQSPGQLFTTPEVRTEWLAIGEDMKAVPGTDVTYGLSEWNEKKQTGIKDPNVLAANREARVYSINGQDVRGMTAAIARLIMDATRLPSIETKMPYVEPLFERQAVVIMGPPAAGKSTIAGKIAYDMGAAIVDSDEAKKIIPEYADGAGAATVHEESSIIGKSMLESMRATGMNLVIPKVGDNLESMQKTLNTLRESGYTVKFVLQDVTPTSALERMASRFVGSGRLIPSFVSDNIGFKPQETFRQMVDQAIGDGHTSLDGEVPYGQPLPIKQTSGAAPITEGPFDPGRVSVRQYRGGDNRGAVSPGPDAQGDGRGGDEAAAPVAEGYTPRTADQPVERGQRQTNPASVAQVTTFIVDRAMGNTARSKPAFHKAMQAGEITPETVGEGIDAAMRSVGSKYHNAVRAVAEALYPNEKPGAADIEKYDGTNEKLVGKKVFTDKWADRYNNAAFLINEIGAAGHGRLYKKNMSITSKRTGFQFETAHLEAGYDLLDFMDFQDPPKSEFTLPMADPNDVSGIVRRKRTNLFAPSSKAMTRAENTARVLQSNTYKLDHDHIAKLQPDDLISPKAYGSLRLKRQANGEVRSTDPDSNGVLNEHQSSRLEEMRVDAASKLKRLQRMAKKHGDNLVGFRYRIDDKGRILADGEFHPQAGDAIKGAFKLQMPDGSEISLKGLPSVDHSASGWQIVAMMARDDVAAPFINIAKDQAFQENPKKADLYTGTMKRVADKIIADANAGLPQAREIQQNIIGVGVPFDRNAIKTPTIAVNYGAGQQKFTTDLRKLFEDKMPGVTKRTPGTWGYLGETTYNELRATAPHSMAFQDWALDGITKLVEAVESQQPIDAAPVLQFTVGLDGKFSAKKRNVANVTVKSSANNFWNFEKEKTEQRQSYQNIEVPLDTVDAKATARTIYSQMVQAFDAAVMHRAVELYRERNPASFVTTNHDSYTIPVGMEAEMSLAARKAMSEIFTEAGDVQQRLYDELVAMAKEHGVDVEISPPPAEAKGAYDVTEDPLTSIPVWGEDAERSDYAPDFIPVARALDLRYGSADLSAYGIEPGKRHKTRDIAAALAARQRDLHGLIKRNDRSPESRAKIADWIAEEVAMEVAMADAQGNSAVGWYSTKFQRALDRFSKKFPELALDGSTEGTAFTSPRHARDFLTALIAITSDGEKVLVNFKRAAQLYEASRVTGRVPTNTESTRGVSMRTNARVINELQEKYGDMMSDYLLQEVTVRDVNAEARRTGKETVSGYQAHMTMPRAALAFGSKLGAFYANLSGSDGYLTMDRWWSRSFNRYRGDLLMTPTKSGLSNVGAMLQAEEFGIEHSLAGLNPKTKAFKQELDRIKQVLADMGKKPLRKDAVLSRITPHVKAYADKGYKNGTPLETAANTVYKAAFEGLNDTPFGATDRTFMIEATKEAQAKLAEQGVDISVADIQAVLWYYEKRLYAEMGARATPDVSYEEVVDRVIAEETDPGSNTGRAGRSRAKLVRGPDGAAFEGADGAGIGDADVPVASGTAARSGGGRGQPVGPQHGYSVLLGRGDASRLSVPAEGLTYEKAMRSAAAAMGPQAAQVSLVTADANVDRYLLDGGSTGYALDGDNIVGVFSTPGVSPQGAAQRVLQDAVSRGGRRLDGFDTFLPKIYARGGFRAVARLAFNPEYAPTEAGGALADWDAAAMEATHPGWGSPDVVFMVYDPENPGPDTDNRVAEYDDGIAAQEAFLNPVTEGTLPAPVAHAVQPITAPEGIQIMPETASIMDQVSEVARNPAAHARKFMEIVEDGVFNRFAPIRRLEIAIRGKLGIGAESAYKAAETAVNDSGRTEALLHYGAAKLGKHGEFSLAPGTVGLYTIFDKVASAAGDKGQNMADWMGWMAAKRIEELQATNPNITFPMKDLQAALAKGQGKPEFQEAADMWKAHNDANIDFLVQTGRISKAQADALKSMEHYVPFYRTDSKADGSAPDLIFPEGYEKKFGGGRANTILSRDPGIKKLVGGDKTYIDNIMKNMIRNSQALVAAGMRNQAANQIFDLMGQAGLAQTTAGRQRGASGNMVDVAKPAEHAVKIWVNGEMKWALPQPGAEPYLVAMAGLQPQQLKGVMALMANIGSVFRQGITLSPAFMVRNLVRGMVANGLLTSGANLTLANNTLTGFRDAYRHGAATQAFKAMSGMGDFRMGGTDVGFGKNDILMKYGLAPKTWGYRVRQAIDQAELVGTATEMADRVAAYNTMIARGMRPDEAAYQARAVMDYARHGGWPALRAWLPMVPFLNARLQGLSRLTEGAVGRRGAMGRKQAAMQLALNGALLSLISTAIWALNNDDDEKEERYKSEPLHRRLNYHIVYAGDKAIYIPKAFELGHLFSSIPELFLDAAVRDMNEIKPGVKKILADTLMFNAIPAGVMPIIEGQSNYSFFRQAPIEGYREQAMRPRDRVTGASSFSRFVGQQLGISDATGVSPVMIEHYLQGFGGAYFHTLSGAVDLAAAETGLSSAPVGGAWGDVPIASRMMERVTGSMFKNVDQQTTKYMEEFYRNKDYITQIMRSAKDAAARGDVEYARDLLTRASAAPAAYKLVNKASSQLSEINRVIRDVRADPKMTPAEKRAAIEPAIRARNDLVKAISKLISDIEEKQGSTFASVA